MKKCPECGASMDDDIRFCTECGASLSDAAVDAPSEVTEEAEEKVEEPVAETVAEPVAENVEEKTAPAPLPVVPVSDNSGYAGNGGYSGVGTNRNIALCIILSIITCGIYGLYWLYCLNKEISELAGEKDYTDGALVIVLTIITCGIYAFYWNYKMGERVDRIKGNSGNTAILFLVLSIVDLDIINYALMQDTINKRVS